MISVYNMKDKLELAAEIQVEYFQLGNINLLNRPQVPAADLIAAGWTDAGTGTATVFSTSYSAGTDGYQWNKNILLHMTPIKPNGTIVSPEGLDGYVESLLTESTISGILTKDASSNKLVIWVQEVGGNWENGFDRGELYDDLLHRLQAVYYLHDYEEFPTETELQQFNKEISVFPPFDGNGDAVLTPISCTVRQVAGGNYDLTMTHPIDGAGKWAHLVPEAIVRAPIPAETITNAYTGLEADVYVTTAAAALRSGPSEPTPITYGEWSPYADYQVGSRVTTSGWSHKNWVCTHWDPESQTRMAPPYNSGWWSPVADMTSGSPTLANIKAGAELYYVSGPTDGWYKLCTKYGLEGYVKATQVQYDRHVTPEETQPRTITTQLFRIRTVQVETKNRQVTVNAQHVSYDLNGVLMEDVEIIRRPPAMSIAILESAYMIAYQGSIATDMVENADTDYSCKLSGKNAMFPLLDPDQGIVPCFDAEFRRDNWDLFIMAKKNTDRGFRIRYGNNLRGVNWNVKGDQLITRVVPVAKAEDGSDLYLSGTKWVNSSRISQYPVIRMERLKVNGQVGKDDGTETGTNWNETTLRAEMQKQAEARFSVDKIDQLQHEITVDFEMLGDTDEYRPLKKLQSVILYDTVIVEDQRVDLSVSVTVTEIEFDCIREKVTAAKLTNVNAYNVKNVSGFNVLNNTITGDKLTDDAGDDIVEEAVEESADYTDTKATQTLQSSKQYTEEYVGSTHSYGSFESYIKAYCDQRYVKQ